MLTKPTIEQEHILAVAAAWTRLERWLDSALSDIKGISFSEYRMLRHLADAPNGTVSRVDLADALARTPSGVTRALRPLEKLGFVETRKSERDARLALAYLTEPGRELVSDASGVINDLTARWQRPGAGPSSNDDQLLQNLSGLANLGQP